MYENCLSFSGSSLMGEKVPLFFRREYNIRAHRSTFLDNWFKYNAS